MTATATATAMTTATSTLPSERGFLRMRNETAPGGVTRVTSAEDIAAAHARLVRRFKTGVTATYEWRMAQLQGLRKLMIENSDAICGAIQADLGRPRAEAFLAEVPPVVGEIDFALSNLKAWMEPQAVPTPLLQQPGRSVIRREPKGVVLKIAPWNFPVNLSMCGICSVLAAGNCCLLKPSEMAPAAERLIAELLPRYLDAEAVQVVLGGVAETTDLLKLRWDHIFYTGNGAIARVVARAAAEHITPLTLELGGKSPVVVLPGAKLPVAARRILSGKCLNAGQICTAPDYVLVHKDVEEGLLAALKQTLQEWFGDDAKQSPNFGRIINQRHFNRVRDLVDSTDGEVYLQKGTMDEASKFMPPTIIRNPSEGSPIMQEEIFGPVMPVLKSGSMDEIIDRINEGEKPLALYIFGREADADQVISRTSSGGVCVNDTIMHLVNPELPFGGVGGSGMGRYHGKWGFDEFSHIRSVMYRATWLDAPQRYPPYSEGNIKLMERIMIGPLLPPGLKKAIVAGGVATVVALACRSRL